MFRIVFVTLISVLIYSPKTVQSEEIHLAARKGDVAQIERLLAEGVPADQPSTRNTSLPGVTALYIAAQFGRVDAVKTLLSAGADPAYSPIPVQTDGTPMHMAARRGSLEIVQLFLDQGADPNLYDRWLGTPLHQAIVNDNGALAALLIANGAETKWQAPPITDLLGAADLENGRIIVRDCASLCHSIDPGAAERSLWNILGASRATRPGTNFSPALKALGGNWTYNDINSFLASPFRYAPGSSMVYSVQDAKSRVDTIAFLRTLSDAPLPLP